MAYTSVTLVRNEIGSNPATADLADADITAQILKADNLIDSVAARFYNKFNLVGSSKTDGTDTYVVPGVIGSCSKDLSVAWSMSQVRAQTANSTQQNKIDFHLGQADVTLGLLRSGDFWLAAEKYRSESLTFGSGTDAWDLDSNEAVLASTTPLDSGDPPHVLLDTLEVTTASSVTNPTNMRRGVEYNADWDAQRAKWIFERIASELIAAATITVTWQWDYRKDYADEPHYTGVII